MNFRAVTLIKSSVLLFLMTEPSGVFRSVCCRSVLLRYLSSGPCYLNLWPLGKISSSSNNSFLKRQYGDNWHLKVEGMLATRTLLHRRRLTKMGREQERVSGSPTPRSMGRTGSRRLHASNRLRPCNSSINRQCERERGINLYSRHNYSESQICPLLAIPCLPLVLLFSSTLFPFRC